MAVPPPPPGAVLDTNVVLDWLVFRDPRVSALTAAVRTGRLRWLSCPAMRAELARMLASVRLARWSPDAGAVLAAHDRFAHACADPAGLSLARPHCSDVDDQVFVDLALTEGARWLLTHDRALLRLARRGARHGLAILTPQRWAPEPPPPDAGPVEGGVR
jgi:predicted nucleic acid-binding protein